MVEAQAEAGHAPHAALRDRLRRELRDAHAPLRQRREILQHALPERAADLRQIDQRVCVGNRTFVRWTSGRTTREHKYQWYSPGCKTMS